MKEEHVKKISSKDKYQVLIKTAAVFVAPHILLLLAMILGLFEVQPCLYSEKNDDKVLRYSLSSEFPVPEEKTIKIVIGNEGHESVKEGDTLIWEGEFDEEGKFRPEMSVPSYFSIFWLPVPHGTPVFNSLLFRSLEETAFMDVTGFLGPKNETYAIKIGGLAGVWSASSFYNKTRKINFISKSESIAGEARYDPNSGLLIKATCLTGSGNMLKLKKSDYKPLSYGAVSFLLALFVAIGLVFYDIVRATAEQIQKGKGIPIRIDFAILGYSAVLVDIFYDFSFFNHGGIVVLVGIHLFMVFMIWYRFGWWAVLPAAELVLAVYCFITFGTLGEAFAFFPASLACWFLVLWVQGATSPGSLKFLKTENKLLPGVKGR